MWVANMPPAKKQAVATILLHCKFEMPVMAWPEVHPLPYLVPNPTKKPPITIKIKPRSVNRPAQLNISIGKMELKFIMPSLDKSATVLLEILILLGSPMIKVA